MTLLYTIPKIGYVPGEFIQFEAFILNSSKRKITGIEVFLMQDSKYLARQGKTRSKRSEINKIQRSGPISDVEWNAGIHVPLIPPTNLGNCKIIHVSYSIQMFAHIWGTSKGLGGYIDLIIGTIPIGSSKPVSQIALAVEENIGETATQPDSSVSGTNHHHHHKSGKKEKRNKKK